MEILRANRQIKFWSLNEESQDKVAAAASISVPDVRPMVCLPFVGPGEKDKRI
jgi:hypothetical protein